MRGIPRKKIVLGDGKEIKQPDSYGIFIWMGLLIALIVSIKVTGFDLSVLIKRGDEFFVILLRMIPPDFSYISYIWKPLFDTIKMSLLGSIFGAILAVPFAVLGSTNIVKSRIVTIVTRLFFSVMRTLPTLVTALIATYLFGLGTIAGTFSIFVFTFSYVGKLLYEQIETVDMGAYEVLESMGATKPKALAVTILPQILPAYIANCLFCFEGNVRYASILGYVGAGGLGMILNEKIGWKEYDRVGMILLMLLLTVFIIEYTSHKIRKRLM
ncbi:MAG: phosphonate ABC transporter, permease protein PhnE [Bacillota bacterium]